MANNGVRGRARVVPASMAVEATRCGPPELDLPQLTRFLIRSGMACLVLGMIAAVLASVSPGLAALRPTWIHLITVGWLTQLIFGVALWMFPRPRTDRPRADLAGWVGFWCLNAGLFLRVTGEPLQVLTGRGAILLAGSAFLQLCAVLSLVFALAPRVHTR